MKAKTVTLNPQEQQRIKYLNEHIAGQLSVREVAELTQVSERQVYRWKAKYREEGVAAMAHGNRGKVSPRRLAEEIRQQVRELAQSRYAGCNQHHLRDLLEEREGICLSRASLRRMLQEVGLSPSKTASLPKHRKRRRRSRREGQLVQIDASSHAWLEERGPRLTLVGGIDDATGKVVGAIFRQQEDQQGYFLIIEQMLKSYGVPGAFYHDRHTMFPARRHDALEEASLHEQLHGSRHETQLGRLFRHLGITSIAARSPQAKGRIERLWGTFQDRLVSELRLAGAQTLEEANAVLEEYLPRFNARFAVPAAEPTPAWQAVAEHFSFSECFCWQAHRQVGSDNTLSYKGQRLQLLPTRERRSWARCQVLVLEQFDGTLGVRFQGQPVPSRQAPSDPATQRRPQARPVLTEPSSSHAHPPAPTHPWRKRFLASSS